MQKEFLLKNYASLGLLNVTIKKQKNINNVFIIR